jgi:hypothetical protein
MAEDAAAKHELSIEITVDGEDLTVHVRELTATEIMTLAGIDPTTHYLVELKEHGQRSFKDDPDTPIHLHKGMRFIANSSGPTPVS